ncbi:MAG: hypothetical protein GY874_06895 [Desulfobacteraceae bacterium]|nr:hypothetical protein [Desulfobacteraceae bacterium]
MNQNIITIVQVLIIAVVVSVLSCGDSPPQSVTSAVVSKKISVSKETKTVQEGTQKTSEQMSADEKQAADAEIKTVSDEKQAAGAEIKTVSDEMQAAIQMDKKIEGKDTAELVSPLVKESLEIASTYIAEGRFDPFEPLFKEEAQVQTPIATKGKSKRKRIPQTPLERVAIAQLKLSAIIRAPSGNKALVEDATGKGYVVRNGTYIGLNSGQVVRIEKNRIVIEEEVENILGELTLRDKELKLQKPAGEL